MRYLTTILLMTFLGSIQAQQTIEVNDVNDFFSSIGPDRTLKLAPGDYHLEKVDPGLSNPYCNWALVLYDEIVRDEEYEDDKTLLISGLANLKIIGSKKDTVRILTNRKTASVLAFQSCASVQIENVVLGHDIVKYIDENETWVSYCSGEVVELFDSKDITIKNSVLFGCGTRAVLAHRCSGVNLIGDIIKECSYGALGVFQSENIQLKKLKIYNNRYRTLFEIEESTNVSVSNVLVKNNSIADGYGCVPFKMDEVIREVFKKARFVDNDFSY